jgi:hypothetical protein
MTLTKLLQSQMNDVLLTIQAAGMDPNDFRWSNHTRINGDLTISPTLIHKKSDYYYNFDSQGSDHTALLSPGADHLKEGRKPGTWENQRAYVAEWLGYLKREITAPDLWGAVAAGSKLLRGATGTAGENTPFTSTERERIAASLRELRDYAVATYQLKADETASLEGRIDYLIEASGRLGRKDWINIAVAVLMGYVLLVVLPPEQARDFIMMAGRALNWLLQSMPLLP